jgi:hypothetical protein
MVMNATVTLTDIQLREILVRYFQEEGLGSISHQDINFNVEYVKTSPERDATGTHKFTGVTVRNVKVGRPSSSRD